MRCQFIAGAACIEVAYNLSVVRIAFNSDAYKDFQAILVRSSSDKHYTVTRPELTIMHNWMFIKQLWSDC